MSSIPSTTLITQLCWRYSTQKFDPARRIPHAAWLALERALVLSPSSHGLQPWKFVVVEEPQLRAALQSWSHGQRQVTDASHLVVFARKDEVTEADVARLVVETTTSRRLVRGALYDDFRRIVRDMVRTRSKARVREWAACQTYLALGNLLTCAALLGIDACPLDAIDTREYDELLGLRADGYSAVCACALGFRSKDDRFAHHRRVRFPAGELVEHR